MLTTERFHSPLPCADAGETISLQQDRSHASDTIGQVRTALAQADTGPWRRQQCDQLAQNLQELSDRLRRLHRLGPRFQKITFSPQIEESYGHGRRH